MEESKKILLSGRLEGKRSLTTDLEKIENRDDIEQFLYDFSQLKISLAPAQATAEGEGTLKEVSVSTSTSNSLPPFEVESITEDSNFKEQLPHILESKAIGLYHDSSLTKLYLAIDTGKIFVIPLQKVSPSLVGSILAKETTIKFAINSFLFIKWCNQRALEIKNLLDIPTYIKLLTNDVDPFQSVESYVEQYTNYSMDSLEQENKAFLCSRFIYAFGTLLSHSIEQFELTTVSKLINENSYFEGNTFNNSGSCNLVLSFTNAEAAIQNVVSDVIKKYEDKAYVVSPLNRIAPKFRKHVPTLIADMYAEDLSITILNELYNNNIPVHFDNQTNQYHITCKFKSFSNVVTLLQAIFSEAFFTLLEQTPHIHMECDIQS